ncbi:PAS domain S-box protein [Chitinibacter bivalviorum]|uniref:histidine kinase n=1 Tax=Chitinibacter bivalviorum TaxID=2739434 RepID=A0A7H9BF47_9NEIS|nr:PAS domain-containing sensor histidine kinase [Chitinibacter bivalviorum]QLG87197.1 PAS domain S-box protein [Chitinibacter bivalviorum]
MISVRKLFVRFNARWHRQWPWWMAYGLVLLLITALGFYVWQTMRNEQHVREAAFAQDLLWQEQELRVRLQSNQNVLENLAYALAADAIGINDFRARADSLMKGNPEILAVEWVDASGLYRGGMPIHSGRPEFLPQLTEPQFIEALDGVATLGYPIFSNVIERKEPLMIQLVPIFRGTAFRGAVLATYSLAGILQQRVPWWLVQRYQLQLVDSQNRVLAPSEFHAKLDGDNVREVAFGNVGSGVRLLAKPVGAGHQPSNWGLFALLLVLLGLLTWSLQLLRLRMQERQLAEAALRDEILFRTAMENSLLTGLRATDTSGRLIYANPAFAQMVGWSLEELQGLKPPLPFWAPEALDECAKAYEAILSGNNPASGFELRYMRKNGERFDVRLYSSRLIDSKGEHRGWMASINDITEIKREREALQQSRQQLRTVLEGLEAAVCVSDVASGSVLYRNRQHLKRFPIPQTEGEHCWVSWRRSHGYQPGSYEFDDVDLITGRQYQIEQRRIDWLGGRGALLEICSDITEQRQAEEEARLRNERLQHTARLVNMGELASSLAHELNQPLAAIASYSTACETMLYKPNPPIGKVQETLVKMTEQARRAGQIIRGIRQLVVKRTSQQAPCSFAELVDVVLPLLTPLAQKTKVKIEVNLPQPCPNVMGDAVLLEQVLFNLLKNGLEAMADTPESARAIAIHALQSHGDLEVRVIDRGCGLADLTQLFQPFYTTKGEGMGMGLNICRSVIEQHKGRLWAEANPGGGTQMCFRLPTIKTDEIILESRT